MDLCYEDMCSQNQRFQNQEIKVPVYFFSRLKHQKQIMR